MDLCLRTRQAEWRVVHFAGAQALHYGGRCTGAVKDMRLFQYLRSRILFVGKYYRSFETICVLLATIFLEIPLRLIRALIVGIRMEVVSVVRGSWMFLETLPDYGPILLRKKDGKNPCSYSIR